MASIFGVLGYIQGVRENLPVDSYYCENHTFQQGMWIIKEIVIFDICVAKGGI